MPANKILVVFGATGNQGGSVINSVLNDSKASQEFKLRGITRDTSSAKAKALSEKGVECVTGDVNDKVSLKSAFKGAHSVFAVTNYWETMDAKLEIQQGKNIADAAKEEGIQHLIFSTLLHVKDLTKGKYPNVYHFDAKADIATYIKSLSIPASFFLPGFYMSNLDSMISPPSPHNNNTYTLALPMPPTTQIPFFDAAGDSGKFVKAMVMKQEEVLGKNVLAATAYYTPEDVIKTFKEVKGAEAQFMRIDEATFKGFMAQAGMPDFAQTEMYENMAFMDEFGYYGKQELGWSHGLIDEKPTTLAEYIGKAKAFANAK